MKKEKRNYEAPNLTVVSFKAEKGFALSGQVVTAKDFGNDYELTDYAYDSENNNLTWGTF